MGPHVCKTTCPYWQKWATTYTLTCIYTNIQDIFIQIDMKTDTLIHRHKI